MLKMLKMEAMIGRKDFAERSKVAQVDKSGLY